MKKLPWVIAIFMLTGCLSNSELATKSATPTRPPTSIVSETATLIEPTSQATQPLFPTFTPPPTLNLVESLTLEDYLENASPCRLPCWGGITPGESNLVDIQKHLNSFNSVSERTEFFKADSWIVGTLDLDIPKENTVVRIFSGYLMPFDGDTVLRIGIDTQSLPKNPKGRVYGDEEYNALLFAYTMPQIFISHGLSNLIYARADLNVGEPTAPDYFIIRLLYLDLGVFISYTMPMETKENTFRFCPSESLINLELTPPDIGENYEDFFQQFGEGEWTTLQRTHHKPLEDAISLTNEEFSQAIVSSPETCFESLRDIWPDP